MKKNNIMTYTQISEREFIQLERINTYIYVCYCRYALHRWRGAYSVPVHPKVPHLHEVQSGQELCLTLDQSYSFAAELKVCQTYGSQLLTLLGQRPWLKPGQAFSALSLHFPKRNGSECVSDIIQLSLMRLDLYISKIGF